MGNLLAYSGIVTKVRAMQAKLLTDEDFQNIAAFHTVTEVAAYLKEHPDIGMSLQIWTRTVFTAVRSRSFLCSHFTVIIHACTVFPEWIRKIPGALSEALRDESDQLLSAYCIQPLSEAF